MYFKDRLIIALYAAGFLIIITMMLMGGLIDFFWYLILVLLTCLVGQGVKLSQVERYKRENHDNLERIANNTRKGQ